MENEQELIDSLWVRVEPGIKTLLPAGNHINLKYVESKIKRTMKYCVLKPSYSDLASKCVFRTKSAGLSE